MTGQIGTIVGLRLLVTLRNESASIAMSRVTSSPDFELDFEGFESEREEDIGDPLDTAQEWDTFVDTEGEEEEEFHRFQVDWTTGNYQPRTTKAFKRTPGIKQPIAVDASPLEVFSLIVTDELWDLLVTETNLYAEQLRTQIPTTSKWTPVSKTEMKTFLGLCLTFGILKLPARRDYWRQTKWLFQTHVPKAMSRDRFDMIWRYLHLQDNVDPAMDKSDKLWKIRRFMDLLLAQFQALYEVNGYASVDESMVKYKGRLSFRQYLPMKPVKWGIKVWVMAESSTGYVNNFQVYTGAIVGKTETGLAHRIVSDLAQPYFGSNLCVYMDNFYTSVKLLLDLQGRGVQACGTVRAGRKDLPKNKELTKAAGLTKHAFNVAQRDDLTFCVWQDTKTVMVLSNFHDPTEHGSVRRRVGGQRQTDVRAPACLADYQKHMKGVDLLDQMVGYYQIHHRSTKWWRRLFFYLIGVVAYNAFVAARSVGGPAWKYRRTGYKDWLEDLAQELIVPVTARSAPSLRPTTPTGASAGHDLAQINSKRKTCKECSLKHSGTDVTFSIPLLSILLRSSLPIPLRSSLPISLPPSLPLFPSLIMFAYNIVFIVYH
uniref:PiggyBac transposable element-derived protein domain-containing protein n=1 Tax=Gadus morhua TaxID=8049 RepID=A0A8C5BAP3_GADMO